MWAQFPPAASHLFAHFNFSWFNFSFISLMPQALMIRSMFLYNPYFSFSVHFSKMICFINTSALFQFERSTIPNNIYWKRGKHTKYLGICCRKEQFICTLSFEITCFVAHVKIWLQIMPKHNL